MSNPDLQKALRESEETYRNLFQNAQVGLFRTRISDGKILEANQQIAKMFGYPSREAFIAEYTTSNNYVDAGTRERMLREIRENGEIQNFEARFYRKDRKIFWASYSARIFPEKGWIEGVVEDIGERRKAEEALKERERQLHLMIENLPGFVYRCRYDHQWTMLYLSEGVYKVTGYTPEELIGNREISFNDLIRKDYQEIIWRAWEKAIKNKSRFEAEYPILNAGGEEKWVWERGRGVFDDQGQVLFLEGYIEDITDRKSVEKRYEILANNTTDVIWTMDMNLNTTYISPSVKELTGTDAEEYLTWPLEKRLVEEDIPHIKRLLEEEIRNDGLEGVNKQRTRLLEIRQKRNDGSSVWVEMNLRFLRNPEGEILGILGVTRDIEERKKSETSLKKIEWMLAKDRTGNDGQNHTASETAYGDLTSLNTHRLILDSVGEEVLQDIARDYLGLLDSSSAIYEKNGDYALGLFSSGWCRFLDASSRSNCQTEDNMEALGCKEWLCHRSCWDEASLPAIEQGEPVDIECHGGIHIYALPVRSGDEIIGAINFGYGDPPRDPEKLKEIAAKYQVPVHTLEKKAAAYESRPPFIVETAKDRLAAAAKLIGEIVSRKRIEEQLRQMNLELGSAIHHKTQELRERVEELERFQEATIEREFRMKELRDEINFLRARSSDTT